MKKGLFVLLLIAGCTLHGKGDDDDQCLANDIAGIAELGTRDAQTGTCTYETECSPGCLCPDTNVDVPIAPGGECAGPCDDLDEADCIANGACHVAYLDGSGSGFWGCWDIAPIEPTVHGDCTALDASDCVVDPTCASFYTESTNGTEFDHCAAAAPALTCADLSCGSGSTCIIECPLCATGDCSCTPACVTDPHDPGDCYDTVTCNLVAPACPDGTLPGIVNGCWSGYCIPTAECETPACTSLTTEAACLARNDCEGVYAGSNCTCDMNGCTCTSETFESCEAR